MIVTFAHYKGGTGKTTSCISIAGHLARARKKVLVVDLDPQGNLTSGLGIDKNSVDASTHHVMNKGKGIRSVIVETDIDNLHLAPATAELGFGAVKSYKSATQARILEKSLAKIKDDYDFVLIDTPPVSSHFIVNGMAAADKVILVMDPGIFSLEGIETLKDSFGQFFEKMGIELKIDSALITRCQKSMWPWKKDYAREIKENVEQMLARDAFLIPFSDEIYDSHVRGLPISHISPRSKISRAYRSVAVKLLREKKADNNFS